MKFDNDILFEFLPEEDKKSFMVWDNVLLREKYSSIPAIVATYRAPFEERIFIPLSEYESRLKQKERDIKLSDIL
jgi:hypothetical protein